MKERLFKIARCCSTTLANVEGFCHFCVKCLKPRQHPVERIPPPQSRCWRSSGALTLAITFKKLINSFRVDNIHIHQTSGKSNTAVNKHTHTERERERERERQTDRHTDKQTRVKTLPLPTCGASSRGSSFLHSSLYTSLWRSWCIHKFIVFMATCRL